MPLLQNHKKIALRTWLYIPANVSRLWKEVWILHKYTWLTEMESQKYTVQYIYDVNCGSRITELEKSMALKVSFSEKVKFDTAGVLSTEYRALHF